MLHQKLGLETVKLKKCPLQTCTQNIIPLNYAITDLWGAKSSVRIYEQLCIVQGFNDTCSSSVIQSFAFSYLDFILIHAFQRKASFFLQFTSYS